jgi:hypothetical protein
VSVPSCYERGMTLRVCAGCLFVLVAACSAPETHDGAATPLPTASEPEPTAHVDPSAPPSAADVAVPPPSASTAVASLSAAPSSSGAALPETLRGTVTIKAIMAVWAANGDKVGDRMLLGFRRCYSKGLELDPKVAGDVRVQANIGANGEVISTKLMKPSALPASVQECMATRVASAMFSPPPAAPGFVKVTIHCDPQ